MPALLMCLRLTEPYRHFMWILVVRSMLRVAAKPRASRERQMLTRSWRRRELVLGLATKKEGCTRKKLRLSKEQSALFEESFKENSSLNPLSRYDILSFLCAHMLDYLSSLFAHMFSLDFGSCKFLLCRNKSKLWPNC